MRRYDFLLLHLKILNFYKTKGRNLHTKGLLGFLACVSSWMLHFHKMAIASHILDIFYTNVAKLLYK